MKDYKVLIKALEEIYEPTKDEYGLKAYTFTVTQEIQHAFWPNAEFSLFSASKQVSLALQKKNISIHDALSAIEAAKAHFKRLQSENEFDHFYTRVVSFAVKHEIEQPVLPRRRKRPKRYGSGAEPHVFLM